MKPDNVENGGSKTAFTFLQSWLRQVTSSSTEQNSTGAVPQPRNTAAAASSKRRKGRPRKYVAAAGDRTLTGDALLVDTASDSGLARFAVAPRAPSPPLPPRPPTIVTAERPPPTASQRPTTSGVKAPAVERTKVGRRKEKLPQRGRRQPVKFIPAAKKRSPKKPKKPRRSKSLTKSSTSSQTPAAAAGGAVAGCVKRPRGRPRKHPVAPVIAPTRSSSAAREAAPSNVAVARRQLTDVEGDSSDSDVIVTGYIAPRHVSTSSREPTRGTPASTDAKQRNITTGATNRGHQSQRRSVNKEAAVNAEVTQPIKRKRGRPRKYPLPTNAAAAAVNSSSGCRRSAAAVQRPATADGRDTVGDRRRVTRALTTAQMQREWDTSRLAAESSVTPARNTPPLYYELSSSDNEESAPDLRSDVERRPRNVRRKRKRRPSIPSRSLELSFSSIEKDDVSGGEGAYYPTSGRPRNRESRRAAKMTSTPSYDRSTSTKDSTLRSRWINVEHRVTEMTTTATVHRDADVQPAWSTRPVQSDITRTAASSQSPGPAVGHRRKRRRRRSSDNDDPDWRRYSTKPSRKPSRGDVGPPNDAAGSTTPVTTSHMGGHDLPAYDDAELDILVELQRRLASTTDGHVLRQVVEVIEASGRYHVEDATFDFDLCSLDRGTITKLRRCLGV